MAVQDQEQPHNLEQLLERLKENTCAGDSVSVGDMLDAVGRRSFGPVLLLFGVIPASPLSGIPGLPSVISVLVLLVVVQLLAGHKHFWLPAFLLNRRVPRSKYTKALSFLQKPARWIDRPLHPRLQLLTRGPAEYVIAVVCLVIALTMPPLELVPFANTTTGIALSVFGLALTANDGLLVMIGLAVFGVSVFLGVRALL
ncbi:exopolysaccharide biosynthesis protein [Gilvimarinus sp. F26214L]|uniref:exopolysaccharide biosynthesis protein n=1 Tax=Gilvimarinus sp. DZF01 TaxID=3461371 RepID=UPI0040465AC9